jgi:hypothetical protein
MTDREKLKPSEKKLSQRHCSEGSDSNGRASLVISLVMLSIFSVNEDCMAV